MTDTKDLIVGVVDNYDWDKIKYWANSIKKSGFDGYKALIVYNLDKKTSDKLTEEGFMLIGGGQFDEQKGFTYSSRSSVMVERFLHIYNFLKMLDEPMTVDRVIMTDVRDVVFQDNPTNWLNTFFLHGFDLLVGSENLKYEDEPWGRNNLQQSFGEYFYNDLKDSEIFCAGVIAGSLDTIKDLCLNIFLVCRGLNPHVPGGGGPDQAALNILLGLSTFEFSTLFTNALNGWVLHAGTSLPAIQAGSGGIGEEYVRNPNMKLPFVNDINPVLKDDSVYVNENKLTIVHQWERVPAWKTVFEKKFGDE